MSGSDLYFYRNHQKVKKMDAEIFGLFQSSLYVGLSFIGKVVCLDFSRFLENENASYFDVKVFRPR